MKFKVGDVVICTEFGLGVITSTVVNIVNYPILVRFVDGRLETYTENGRMYLLKEDDGEHIRKLSKLEKAMR